MRSIFVILITAFIGTVYAAPKVQATPVQPPTVLVYNLETNQSVYSDNVDAIRPMASITKLMTAMVTLDHFQLSDRITIGKKQTATVESLLIKVLVRSDNHASEQLARAYPGGRQGFLLSMHTKSQSLGLESTRFDDPSGLLMTNTSTARDLVKLVAAAGNYPFIRDISSKPEIIEFVKDKKRTKQITLSNTNRSILADFQNIIVSKTGFTSRAGRCLAMLVERQGAKYAVIILGEPSKQAREKIARNILAYTLLI